MKKFVFIVLCFLGLNSTFAAEKWIPIDTEDECELRAWIAFTVIQKKKTDTSLKIVKDDFYTWLTIDRLPELAPSPSNLVIGWYNDWGPEEIQDWFKRTYTKEEADTAFNEELTDCRKNNGEPPDYVPARKL